MPEHAPRTSAAPTDRPHRSGRFRRGRLAFAACAVAGAGTLGACTPGQVGTGNHAVNVAFAYLGTPYVYGGASPGGFDCSGLTQYVYSQLGKQLPRSAQQQYEAVPKVSQSAAKKGDLIFFGTPGAVYHVALYEGNGMILHAPSTGSYVSIVPIWTSDYTVGRVA